MSRDIQESVFHVPSLLSSKAFQSSWDTVFVPILKRWHGYQRSKIIAGIRMNQICDNTNWRNFQQWNRFTNGRILDFKFTMSAYPHIHASYPINFITSSCDPHSPKLQHLMAHQTQLVSWRWFDETAAWENCLWMLRNNMWIVLKKNTWSPLKIHVPPCVSRFDSTKNHEIHKYVLRNALFKITIIVHFAAERDLLIDLSYHWLSLVFDWHLSGQANDGNQETYSIDISQKSQEGREILRRQCKGDWWLSCWVAELIDRWMGMGWSYRLLIGPMMEMGC